MHCVTSNLNSGSPILRCGAGNPNNVEIPHNPYHALKLPKTQRIRTHSKYLDSGQQACVDVEVSVEVEAALSVEATTGALRLSEKVLTELPAANSL